MLGGCHATCQHDVQRCPSWELQLSKGSMLHTLIAITAAVVAALAHSAETQCFIIHQRSNQCCCACLPWIIWGHPLPHDLLVTHCCKRDMLPNNQLLLQAAMYVIRSTCLFTFPHRKGSSSTGNPGITRCNAVKQSLQQ